MLGAILAHSYSYVALLFVIHGISLVEFYGLCRKNGLHVQTSMGSMIGIMTFTLGMITYLGFLPLEFLFMLLPPFFLVFALELYRDRLTPFTNIALTLAGIFYITFPFLLLLMMTVDGETYNPQLVMTILFVVWANDSGAYFVGKSFGKTPLFERISPKKTWEGSIGGGVVAMAVGILLYFLFKETGLSLTDFIVVTLIIIVTGGFGDLIESMFKRSLAVKDSGSIIPGHGGFLDRFDGLIYSIPFVFTYLHIFR